MTENRATEHLSRCYGVYSDISCGNCPYRRYEKEGPGCIYALHKDAFALLKEQEEKICSAKEIAMDESTNAAWREDFEAWKVLDRIVQKLS